MSVSHNPQCQCACHGMAGPYAVCDIEGGCGHLHKQLRSRRSETPTTGGNNICGAPRCDQPPHNGFLCTTCSGMLHRDLLAVADLAVDLDITISKQDRLADKERRPSSERPLPLKLGPMETRRDLTATLAFWAEHTSSRLGHELPALFRDNAVQLAGWLHTFTLVDDPEVGEMCDEIGYAVIRARRAIDKPAEMLYAGPCECDNDLYAHPRAPEIECRECGAVYDVEGRRNWLLDAAEDQLLTATDMSRALPGLINQPLTSAMIRGWARHGRITQHPPLPRRPRDPTYRVGDILGVLLEMQVQVRRTRRKVS